MRQSSTGYNHTGTINVFANDTSVRQWGLALWPLPLGLHLARSVALYLTRRVISITLSRINLLFNLLSPTPSLASFIHFSASFLCIIKAAIRVMTLLCGQITLKVLNDIRSLAFYTQIINTHSQSTELADFHLYYATEACKCKWSNDGAMMIVLRQVDKDTAAANDLQWNCHFR